MMNHLPLLTVLYQWENTEPVTDFSTNAIKSGLKEESFVSDSIECLREIKKNHVHLTTDVNNTCSFRNDRNRLGLTQIGSRAGAGRWLNSTKMAAKFARK